MRDYLRYENTVFNYSVTDFIGIKRFGKALIVNCDADIGMTVVDLHTKKIVACININNHITKDVEDQIKNFYNSQTEIAIRIFNYRNLNRVFFFSFIHRIKNDDIVNIDKVINVAKTISNRFDFILEKRALTSEDCGFN